jgi:hypothetical protein
MAFKFRLYSQSGEELGDYVTAVPNWARGDRLYEDGRSRFEVVDVIDLTDVVDPSEETEHFLGALVVAPIGGE